LKTQQKERNSNNYMEKGKKKKTKKKKKRRRVYRRPNLVARKEISKFFLVSSKETEIPVVFSTTGPLRRCQAIEFRLQCSACSGSLRHGLSLWVLRSLDHDLIRGGGGSSCSSSSSREGRSISFVAG
jgi:hypothetical protein